VGHDRAHDTTTRTDTETPPMAIDPRIVTISKHLLSDGWLGCFRVRVPSQSCGGAVLLAGLGLLARGLFDDPGGDLCA